MRNSYLNITYSPSTARIDKYHTNNTYNIDYLLKIFKIWSYYHRIKNIYYFCYKKVLNLLLSNDTTISENSTTISNNSYNLEDDTTYSSSLLSSTQK